MSFTSLETQGLGFLKMARIVNNPQPHTEKGIFRVVIKDCVSMGEYNAFVAPSPYGGSMPSSGMLVTYLDYPGYKYVINLLGDTRENPGGADRSPTMVNAMSPNDTYIGREAQAYFNHDVSISSYLNVSSLHLDADTGLSNMSGRNFELQTGDDNIRVFTGGTGPFGDSVTIQKNLGDTKVPVSEFGIDRDGGFFLECGMPPVAGTDPAGLLTVSKSGDVTIKNTGATLSMLPSGRIEINSVTAFNIDSASLTVDCETVSIGGSKSISLTSQDTAVNGTLRVTGVVSAGGLTVTSGAVTFGGALASNGPASFTGGATFNSMFSTDATIATVNATSLNASSVIFGALFTGSLPGPGGAFVNGMPFQATLPVVINGTPYRIPCIQ